MYEMCDTLSRNRAYIEKDFSTEKTLLPIFLSNTHAAKLLGAFDESRFIELLQNDPLACRFSRLYRSQVCGANRHWKASRFPYGFRATERASAFGS